MIIIIRILVAIIITIDAIEIIQDIVKYYRNKKSKGDLRYGRNYQK